MRPSPPRIVLAAALAALALAFAGCGSSASGPVHATLVLDFVPNAVHAGVYRALTSPRVLDGWALIPLGAGMIGAAYEMISKGI